MSRRPQKWTPLSRPRGRQQRALHSTASPVPIKVIVPPHRHPHRVGSAPSSSSPVSYTDLRAHETSAHL
eukprot:5057350-Alexandrium_andersonii.AAC.1